MLKKIIFSAILIGPFNTQSMQKASEDVERSEGFSGSITLSECNYDPFPETTICTKYDDGRFNGRIEVSEPSNCSTELSAAEAEYHFECMQMRWLKQEQERKQKWAYE